MAEQLELERIGPQHQAGSDSLLTGMAFFKMREVGSPGQSRERAGAFTQTCRPTGPRDEAAAAFSVPYVSPTLRRFRELSSHTREREAGLILHLTGFKKDEL